MHQVASLGQPLLAVSASAQAFAPPCIGFANG
jgi:hypothetical protein